MRDGCNALRLDLMSHSTVRKHYSTKHIILQLNHLSFSLESADDMMVYHVCTYRVHRGMQYIFDRQEGQPIVMFGPNILIGQTFYGPKPSTDYINTRVGD